MADTIPGASAPHCATPDSEPAPINLHSLSQNQAAMGYTHGLTLNYLGVQELARRIHGISAITAVLVAATDSETLDLGDWMRHGLLVAVDALARDAQGQIERDHDRAVQAPPASRPAP